MNAQSPISLLPNLISLGRLLAVPLMVYLVLEQSYVFAFWLFLAAGISDAVDGFIAKQFGAETELGTYLDPLADKALLVAIYVTLGRTGDIATWLVILIVSRDLMIIGGALLFQTLTQSLKMEPLWISKANTTFQIALAGLVLAQVAYEFEIAVAVDLLLYIVAGTTVLSGGAYIVKWGRRVLNMEDMP